MADISVDRLLHDSRAGVNALIAAREHLERLQKISKSVEWQRSDILYKAEIRRKTDAAERAVCDLIALTYDTIIAAMDRFRTLPPEECMVMMDYYIIGYDWKTIAERRHFSERTVYNIRDRAIKRLKGEI